MTLIKDCKGYKLTNQDGRTFNAMQWGSGVMHETDGSGELCSKGWLHYYRDPLLAILHNPIHSDIPNPVLWECKIEGKRKHDGWMKSGCTKLTTVKPIFLPIVTLEQRIRYAILCAKEVCKDKIWNQWADKWLSGEDRTAATALRTRDKWAAMAPEWAAAWAGRAVVEAEPGAAEAAARTAAAASSVKPLNLLKIVRRINEA